MVKTMRNWFSAFVLGTTVLSVCGVVRVHVALYNKDTPYITYLDASNFNSIVYENNSTGSSTWFVQFYAHWCGHCQNFVKVWKPLSADLHVWDPYVRVGAINCAEYMNMEICTAHNVTIFPALKLFPAGVTQDVGPHAIQYTDTGSDIEYIRSQLAHYLRHLEQLSFLQATPYDAVEIALQETTPTIYIVQAEGASLAQELTMSLSSHTSLQQIMIIEGSRMNVQFRSICEKLGVKSNHAVVRGNGLEHLEMIFESNNAEDRIYDRFKTRLDFSIFGGEFLDEHGNHIAKRKMALTTEAPIVYATVAVTPLKPQHGVTCPAVDVEDAVTAAFHALRQEVSLHQEITGERFTALLQFMSIVSMYLPCSQHRDSDKFFNAMNDWLEEKNQLDQQFTVSEWKVALQVAGDTHGWEISTATDDWTGCLGSTPQYRGYPCGMWVLFHTLLASATAQADDETEHVRALEAVVGYIRNFFSCEICVQNFQHEFKPVTEDWQFGEPVLALWQMHNSVNMRLHSNTEESSNDPQYPKLPFPLLKNCDKCQTYTDANNNIHWNHQNVLTFLLYCFANNGSTTSEDSWLKLPLVHGIAQVPNDGKRFLEESADAQRLRKEKAVERTSQHGITCPEVDVEDAVTAAFHALRQEVALHREIKGERFAALSHFMSVVSTYLPCSRHRDSDKFFNAVDIWVQSKKVDGGFSVDEWKETLRIAGDEHGWKISTATDDWVGCQGSNPRYRGYPCGLWVLFHTLLASATSTAHDEEVGAVLEAIVGYIENFFSCAKCVIHFQHEFKPISTQWKFGEPALVLWQIHNRVNRRLHSDVDEISNDPQHPKLEYPLQQHCEKCQTNVVHDNGAAGFNHQEVLKLLLYCYANNASTREGHGGWLRIPLLYGIARVPKDGKQLLDFTDGLMVSATHAVIPPSPPVRMPTKSLEAIPDEAAIEQAIGKREFLVVPTLRRESSATPEESKPFPIEALGLLVIACMMVNLILFLTCCGMIRMGQKTAKKEI